MRKDLRKRGEACIKKVIVNEVKTDGELKTTHDTEKKLEENIMRNG